jgi:glycosyltransferase involved in cell wall biosynthesis
MPNRKLMRILIATDTWHPQFNGVLHSLLATASVAETAGARFLFLNYEGLRTVALPHYPEIRLAIPRAPEIIERLEAAKPDAIHIATEGPIGYVVRRYCIQNSYPFTTSFHTRLPEYLSARMPFPESWTWACLRRYHAPSAAVMVATSGLAAELTTRSFRNVLVSPLGVNTDLFYPRSGTDLGLPRPIFLSVGRIAVEKNFEAFLALHLPGTKVIVGDGPQRADLARRFPDAVFLGRQHGEQLARTYAAADVFVFPSRTDTFGLVLLEALASGVPIAAFPVSGPRDVIGNEPVGILDHDLNVACMNALHISRERCREYVLCKTWENSAQSFVSNIFQSSGFKLPFRVANRAA